MNKIALFIFTLFFTQLSFAQDWTLAKNEDGIKVYTRVVEGSSFKEFKGETQIQSTLANFVALLRDVPNFHLFFDSAMEPKLLKREGDTIQIHYLQTKAPWPVSNRDGIYQYLYRYNKKEKELFVGLKALPTYSKKEDGFIRIPKATGFWKAKQVTPTQLKIVYQLLPYPGGSIPAWLANTGAVDLPFNTLTNLKKRIILKQYQNKKFPF